MRKAGKAPKTKRKRPVSSLCWKKPCPNTIASTGRVAARLPLRNEDKMDAEEKMQPDDPGEAVAIAAASRRRHLVVHLSDSGKSHDQKLNFFYKVQLLEINYISSTNETTKTLSVFFMFELGGLPV